MITYQEFIDAAAKGQTIAFIEDAIKTHKASAEYLIAADAERYMRKQNTTIREFKRKIYDMAGNAKVDPVGANFQCASGFFKQNVTQLTQYLLANGVTFEKDDTKDKLGGADFDRQLARATRNALAHGIAFGFLDYDTVHIFKITEFVPMWDEVDGTLKAGIYFWQITADKPLRADLYTIDGKQSFIKPQGEAMKPMEGFEQPQPYKLQRAVVPFDNTVLYEVAQNYPSLPIVPIYGNEEHQSELIGIKENIDAGNVVVTGGYPNTWQYVTLSKKSGNLGKPGDSVITFATNNPSGGHNVSIVGYDDELTVTANGITTKGAFLIANSWGRSYGRNGYAWITYDALNSVSDYEEFVFPEDLKKEGLERDWPFDQFCFLYWDSDLLFETPALYAEIEVSVANRDAFGVELSRTDANGQTETFSPSMFAFREMHIKYDDDIKGYLNPAGIIDGPAVDFGFAVNLEMLMKDLPAGADYENYLFGIDVRSFDDSAQLVIKSITLKNAAGETLRALTFGEGRALSGNAGENFVFSFSSELKESFLDGEYTFKSAVDGSYIAKSGVVGLASGKEKDAMKFTVTRDPDTGLYVLSRTDGFVLEFKDGIKEGSEAVFNKQQFARADIQTMHISYVEGGGICFFAVDEHGVNYALCFDGGKLRLARADALEDRFCFEILPPKAVYGGTNVTVGDALTVSGTTSVKASEAHLALVAADGTVLAEKTAAVTSRAYTESFDLPNGAGIYYIEVTDETGKPIGSSFVFEIKGA